MPRTNNFGTFNTFNQIGAQMQQMHSQKVVDEHSRTHMSRSKSPPEAGVTPSTQHTQNNALNQQLGANQNIFNNTLISKRKPSPQGAAAAFNFTPGGSNNGDSISGNTNN